MAWWSFKRNEARRYAAELPRWLAGAYGAGEHYTVGQIRRGVAALKLDPRHLDLAFAAFMTEADYRALAAEQPEALPYAEARARFEAMRPKAGPSSQWDPLDIERTGSGREG